MTEQTATTTTTSESDRTKYNRRLREKRTKGHSLQMIADYALKCPVPIEQLDMTPEEKAEIERMRKKEVNKVMDHISWRRHEIANYVLESGVPIDQLELLPGELAEIARIQNEDARRKEQRQTARQPSLEAIAAKVKAASSENTIQFDDPSVFDNLAKSGVLCGSLSFAPRGGWRVCLEGEALTDDYRLWKYNHRQGQWSNERLGEDYPKTPESLPMALYLFQQAVDDKWLGVKFPNSKATLIGTVYFHVPTRAAVLDHYKQLPDVSTLPGLFDTLAQHGVVTVKLSFEIESWNHWEETQRNLHVHVSEMLNANGEEVEFSDADLWAAIRVAAEDDHGEQAILEVEGDECSTGGDGTITFHALDRKVSVNGELGTEEDDDYDLQSVDETWSIDETERATA